jgi:hypothetical protein
MVEKMFYHLPHITYHFSLFKNIPSFLFYLVTKVPEKLRVGPWTPIAPIILVSMTAFVIQQRPTKFLYESPSTLVSTYQQLYSPFWWYNIAACIYMNYLLYWVMTNRSKGVVVTYTILSWILNATGHGINALAPFLYDHHILLQINRMIRFPALASASITFTVWNIALLPFIHFYVLDTAQKRHNFTMWNLNFRMVQKHIANIIYAILNTIITRRSEQMVKKNEFLLFEYDDLWYGMTFGLIYGLFYNLILDRIGVHLYPIFSPRSNYVIFTWVAVFALYFGFYKLSNEAMQSEAFMKILTLPILISTNVTLTVISLLTRQVLSRK